MLNRSQIAKQDMHRSETFSLLRIMKQPVDELVTRSRREIEGVSEATALAKECPALESSNIERSTAFISRKDVALKDISLGVDENSSLGPLVATLGEDGPRNVVLML